LPRSPEPAIPEAPPIGGRAGDAVRILGIDPGSRVTGYGVIDFAPRRVSHVASGCIYARGDDLGERLCSIHREVGVVVETYRPAEMAIEQVFMARNPASALKLGQARAAAMLAGVLRGLALNEYMPNKIKQAVVGHGHAGKQQVQHMVKALLGLAEAPPSDAADALAVALCHGNLRATRARLARAGAREAR